MVFIYICYVVCTICPFFFPVSKANKIPLLFALVSSVLSKQHRTPLGPNLQASDRSEICRDVNSVFDDLEIFEDTFHC